MAENNIQLNKDRSNNFTKEETDRLMQLIRKYTIITNKKTDHTSVRQKDQAWICLADEFNEGASFYRGKKQLQNKFNNLKKVARQEMSQEKRQRRQTGGGPPPPKPSVTSEWLNDIMGESITGLPAVYDSDVVHYKPDGVLDSNDDASVAPSSEIGWDITQDNKSYLHEGEEALSEISATPQSSQRLAPKTLDMPVTEELDTTTPRAMLRRPVSQELRHTTSKRKHNFSPLEARKQFISLANRKEDFINLKTQRESVVVQFAEEEHKLNLLHKTQLHQIEVDSKRRFHQMEEDCKAQLHQIEMDFKTKLFELKIKKAEIEVEVEKLKFENLKSLQ